MRTRVVSLAHVRASGLTRPRFREKMSVSAKKNLVKKENGMRKVKYVKPGVVGGSSVHPC